MVQNNVKLIFWDVHGMIYMLGRDLGETEQQAAEVSSFSSPLWWQL